jgi:hypothetical protein
MVGVDGVGGVGVGVGGDVVSATLPLLDVGDDDGVLLLAITYSHNENEALNEVTKQLIVNQRTQTNYGTHQLRISTRTNRKTSNAIIILVSARRIINSAAIN